MLEHLTLPCMGYNDIFDFDYKKVFRVAVNTYIPIFRGLDERGGRKLRTGTHTRTHRQSHTRENHSNVMSIVKYLEALKLIRIIYTALMQNRSSLIKHMR